MNRCWGIVCWYPIQSGNCVNQQADCISKTTIDLKNSMRRLWAEHVTWTRATVSGLVINTLDACFVVSRLLQHTTDMGDAIRPYYGDVTAQEYSQLLGEYITLAGDLIKAMTEGNTGKAAEIERN